MLVNRKFHDSTEFFSTIIIVNSLPFNTKLAKAAVDYLTLIRSFYKFYQQQLFVNFIVMWMHSLNSTQDNIKLYGNIYMYILRYNRKMHEEKVFIDWNWLVLNYLWIKSPFHLFVQNTQQNIQSTPCVYCVASYGSSGEATIQLNYTLLLAFDESTGKMSKKTKQNKIKILCFNSSIFYIHLIFRQIFVTVDDSHI